MAELVSDNLKHKAAKGIIWKFLDQGGTQLIQFFTNIYIARILLPEDYGLVGMMAIFLGIAQVFIDSGFKTTLIQKGIDVSQDEYNIVFYFNTSVSLFFYLIIFTAAPIIANFYHEPRLVAISRVLGIYFVLTSLGIIQQIILEKRINFKTLTKINLISILTSVTSGVILAVKGFGVWSLVSMYLVESFVRTTLLWIINKWRPTLSFGFKTFKALFNTSSKLLFSGIVNQISMSGLSIIIGRVFTVDDVGYYNQAKKLQQRIGDFMTYSIQGVLFPVQSLMKDDLPRLKNAVRTNIKISTLVAFPAIFGLMAIAKPFIFLVLTEKWLPSVDYIYILSIAGLFFVLHGAIGSYIIPLGKINFYLKYITYSNLFLIVIFFVCIIFHMPTKILVSGKILQEFFNFIFVVRYSKKHIKYAVFELIKDITFPVLASLSMGIIVYGIGEKLGMSYSILALQVITGIGLYLLFNYLLNRELFFELVFQLKKLVKR